VRTTLQASVLLVALRLLAVTWRVRVLGAEHLHGVRRSGRGFVFALWHGGLIPLLWHHRRQHVTLLVSQHGDGEVLARAARRLGYTLVRGSSTRGGVGGLRAAVRILRLGGAVAITPDGPRGPARAVKPGVLAAGRQAGVSILPVAAAASRAWTVASWDRLIVPRPFARITIAYGPVIAPETAATAVAESDLAKRLDAVSHAAAAAA